jgi:hypothetical protein
MLRLTRNNAAVHHNSQVQPPLLPQPQPPHGGAMAASDYAILKFNNAQNGVNVGKEIDV